MITTNTSRATTLRKTIQCTKLDFKEAYLVRISLIIRLVIDNRRLSAKVIATEKITDLKIRAIITRTAGTNITMIETVEMLRYIQTSMTGLVVVNIKENQAFKTSIKLDNLTFNQLIQEIRLNLYRERTMTSNSTKTDRFNVSQVTFSLWVIMKTNKCRTTTVNVNQSQLITSLHKVLKIALLITRIENNSRFRLCNTNQEGWKQFQNSQYAPAFKIKSQHRASKVAMGLVKAGLLKVIHLRLRSLNRSFKRCLKHWSILPIKLPNQNSSKSKCSPNWIKKCWVTCYSKIRKKARLSSNSW